MEVRKSKRNEKKLINKQINLNMTLKIYHTTSIACDFEKELLTLYLLMNKTVFW